MGAHIYIRVSTDDQAEGFSLSAQQRACELYCELMQLPVANIYADEGYSGTTGNRPALQRLLAAVQAGDTIVVHKVDRFSRNTQMLLTTLGDLTGRKVRLVSVSEQLDFSSPIGTVFLTLLAAFAQFYVDNLRTETKKGIHEKSKQGLWVGPVPVGYRSIKPGYIEPSDDAETIREIYRMFVDADMSYKEIAAELNARGLRASDWKSKERRPWGRENVRVVLRARSYIGYVSAGGVERPGIHEPLITEEYWQAAADKRQRLTLAKIEGRPRARYTLHCEHCGKRLWFTYGGKRSERALYYCRGKHLYITAGIIERAVDQLLSLVNASIEAIAAAIYVSEMGIASIEATAGYSQLLSALGYRLRQAEKPPCGG